MTADGGVKRADWFPAEADPLAETGFKGYNFLGEGRESALARLGKLVLTATYYLSGMLRRLSGKLWSVNLSRRFSPHLFAYPRHRAYFRARGEWDDYRALCARLGVSPDSFHTAKAYYLAGVVDRHAPAGPLRVLEIGSGPGLLATMLLDRRPGSGYALVDMPDMLRGTERTLAHFFPERRPRRAPEAGPLEPSTESALLLEPGDCPRLAGDAFDLVLCIDLLPVLDAGQVRSYLELAQRVARPGGLFITLNFRKQAGGRDNNPLLYPHLPNELLCWETDPFHYEVLKFDLKDLFMLRVERVRK